MSQRHIKRVLYLGLRPPSSSPTHHIIHYPVIAIIPQTPSPIPQDLSSFTHFLFTSQTAVELFAQHLPSPSSVKVIAVGKATASRAQTHGFVVSSTAELETAEGVVLVLEQLDLTNANILWPRSAQARPVISDYLRRRQVPLTEAILYHVALSQPTPIPHLSDIDEVLFTSPSTVDGFLAIFPSWPNTLTFRCLGPVTAQYLAEQPFSSKACILSGL